MKATLLQNKLQSNFIKITLRHGCFPVSLLDFYRTPFFIRTSVKGCFWSMFFTPQIAYCPYDFFLDLNPPNLKLISSPEVIEGSSLVLSCEVDASKPIIYRWYKGSQQLQGQSYLGIKKNCQEKLTVNCLKLIKKTTWMKRTAITVVTSPLENER